MIAQVEILTLIPHAGRMCLIDAVSAWDERGIQCEIRNQSAADHPLRRHNRLAALHLIEYGAQAMAIHGGLLARAAGRSARPGMLVAVRDFTTPLLRLDDLPGQIEISAARQMARADALLYSFEAQHAGRSIGSGRVTVMLIPDLQASAERGR